LKETETKTETVLEQNKISIIESLYTYTRVLLALSFHFAQTIVFIIVFCLLKM